MEYQADLIKKNITEKSDMISSGPEGILEKYNAAIGFDIKEGKYSMDIIGLKRKVSTERESNNCCQHGI